MADIDLKTATPDTSLPTTGFLFGADSQAAASPSVYSTQTVATTLLGSTSLTGATITTSQPVLDLSQTWNASGVTFTGLRFNAAGSSDANSAAGSLLMDLQVGGASRFSVNKAGLATFAGGFTSSAGSTVSNNLTVTGELLGGSNIRVGATGVIYWNTGGGDLQLSRRAAANLRLGAADAAAPVAQTLSVQSVVAGTSNTAGTNFTITGSQGTGTGAGGSIVFQVAPAGSSGTAQNALVDTITIASNGNVTLPRAGAASLRVDGEGYYALSSGSIRANFSQFGCRLTSGLALSWSDNTSNPNSVIDTILLRDAANTLALRNGANAQTFRVYNTFTSATEFERGNIFWDSNVLKIGTEKGSAGGTARALEFQTDGTTRLTIGTTGNATFTSWIKSNLYFDAPAASLGGNGGIYFGTASANGSQVQSTGAGVIALGNYGGSDFNRIQFGGTTSSFPALKRNSTALETKLADDSAYAPHAMQYLDVTDGITAPASATGRARIYVDTADGDLKVIFADGTVKTIVTDT